MKTPSFSGIRNTVSSRDLSPTQLQEAVDVDFTDVGGVVQRKGYSLSQSIPITQAYSTVDGVTYIVTGGNLCRVEADLSLVTLAPTTADEFCDYQHILFTNDGLSVTENAVTNLVIPSSTIEPDIIITGGNWVPGQYMVAYTYVNSDGLEGGTSPITMVILGNNQSILVNPPLPPAGTTTRVYISVAGGEVLYLVGTPYQVAPINIGINGFPSNADKIEFYESCVYVSVIQGDYSTVFPSKPFHFHLFGLNYFTIPGKILAMKAANGGLIIGTNNEIYVYADDNLTRVASYGVIPGRSIVKLPDGNVIIHSVRGLCSALPFTPLTEENVSLPMGTKCSATIMFDGGIQKYVGLHDAGGTAYNKF